MKPSSSQTMVPASSAASRRGFLGLIGGALVAAGATLATKSANAAPVASETVASASASSLPSGSVVAARGIFTMLDHLSLDAFSAQLNTPFHVPDAGISLQLVKATDTSRADNVRSFQLIMVGPLEPVLTPDTHLLRHATMGDMALFISPFKQDDSGTRYHVSFSQLVN